MIQFTYTIQDPQGIHARPAGMLVKEAAKFQSKCSVAGNGKKLNLDAETFDKFFDCKIT